MCLLWSHSSLWTRCGSHGMQHLACSWPVAQSSLSAFPLHTPLSSQTSLLTTHTPPSSHTSLLKHLPPHTPPSSHTSPHIPTYPFLITHALIFRTGLQSLMEDLCSSYQVCLGDLVPSHLGVNRWQQWVVLNHP